VNVNDVNLILILRVSPYLVLHCFCVDKNYQ